MNPSASSRSCIGCGRGPRQVELRPYGRDGAPICSECMHATPERKAEAQRQIRARMARVGAPVPAVLLPAGQAERAAIALERLRTVPFTCARCMQPIGPEDLDEVDDGGRRVHAVCPDWLDALRADKVAKNAVACEADEDEDD